MTIRTLEYIHTLLLKAEEEAYNAKEAVYEDSIQYRFASNKWFEAKNALEEFEAVNW